MIMDKMINFGLRAGRGYPRLIDYHGGKRRLAGWILDKLPPVPGKGEYQCYIEPFCGMATILLSRERCPVEIINDANGRLVNFLIQIRDNPELSRRLLGTPYSRAVFDDAITRLDDDNPEESALAFGIVVGQGLTHGDDKPKWGKVWKSKRMIDCPSYKWIIPESLEKAIRRLRGVQIECCDAVELLAKAADKSHTVIYLDPPYSDTATEFYSHSDIDRNALQDVLQRQQGAVAISGYKGEWDDLGWHRDDIETASMTVAQGGINIRTESLWRNDKCLAEANKQGELLMR